MKRNCKCCNRQITEAKYKSDYCRRCQNHHKQIIENIIKKLNSMRSLTLLEILHKKVIDKVKKGGSG